jgi:hypothetical protein
LAISAISSWQLAKPGALRRRRLSVIANIAEIARESKLKFFPITAITAIPPIPAI